MPSLYRPRGWKYNLPSPNTLTEADCNIAQLETPPNHANNIYMEMARTPLKIRGYWIIVGCLITILSALLIVIPTLIALISPPKIDIQITMIGTLLCIFIYWIMTPYVRMDIQTPCNEPIRFNRTRRKVYFYQYRFDRLHPLGKRNWGVKPVAYNWDDLTAEAYRVYAPLGYGGLIENIMISVRNPETDEVIDRVFFASDLEQGKRYWALARLFMQKGPEALPDFVYSPADWNSDESSNPFDRLAPKVQWPADMDLESRTAPDQGDES